MISKKPKLLICGASGFIGSNAVEYFAKSNQFDLYALIHKTQVTSKRFIGLPIKFVRADLRKASDVTRVIRGMDIVIQAAATTSGSRDIINRPYYHVTDNAVMNSLILRASFEQKVKHFIFFSCTTMYQESNKPVHESDFNHRIIPKYFGVGWTKVYIENMCEFYSRIGTTKFTVIRHSNVYGPYDKYDLERSHVFGATVTKVLRAKGDRLVVWGDGSDERDLIYVDDLMRFISLAIKKQRANYELVNVGLGKSISVKQLVAKLILFSGKKLVVEYDRSKPSINYKLAINISYAKKIFGWVPKVSLDEGIRKTLKWYRAYFNIRD